MRLAILSDIHGNLPALEAVWADLRQFSPDGLVVAGDYVGGPQADKAMAVLQSAEPVWMILGNSDINALEFADGQKPEFWHTHKQFALARWVYQDHSQQLLDVLWTLPRECVLEVDGTEPIYVVHGKPGEPYDGLDPEGDLDALHSVLDQMEETVLICGHTHRPWVVERNGKLALNPGSVAAPLNGYVGTQYALLDWKDGRWQARLQSLSYDMARIRAAFIASGLLEEGGALARCFLRSIETGRDVSLQFLSYARGLAEQAGVASAPLIPDEIWDQAAATFDWAAV